DADNTLPWRPAAGEAGRISGYQPNGVAGGGADRRSAGPPVVGEGILCAGYAPWRRYRRFLRHLADHRRTSNGTCAAGPSPSQVRIEIITHIYNHDRCDRRPSFGNYPPGELQSAFRRY